MANKLTFILLSCMLNFGYAPFLAANESIIPENIPLKVLDCQAPAPDSFRVVSSGSDIVSLNWIPVWVGATQTLEVSVKVADNWFILFTNSDVSGDSYALDELYPGYYKARISTNCPTGGSGFDVSEIFFEFKIIDLSTAGRIPQNPAFLGNCAEIDYLSHRWVGFQVREISTGMSNLFEIELTGAPYYLGALVKRVYDNPIVAVDKDGLFPLFGGASKKVMSPFEMDDTSKSQPPIGFVLFNRNNDLNLPPIIFLCKDTYNSNQQWKNEYEFTIMTAESIIIGVPAPPIGSEEKTTLDTISYSKFKAQSPFNESLNVFTPPLHSKCGKTIFHLLDTNGQIIFDHKIDHYNNLVSFPTPSISPGIYILHIENDCETHALKVVKSE